MKFLSKKNKKVEKKCRNCLLYNNQKQHCSVLVLYNGEKINPPTSPEDDCIFEEEYKTINEKGVEEVWKPQVEEVKMWVENEKGERSDKGIVKIQYPISFFGAETDEKDTI
jgi:hypothetical protein